MPSVPIGTLVHELQGLYHPPFGAVNTWQKIRQVLVEFQTLASCELTEDFTPAAVGRWILASAGRAAATTRSLLSSFRRACSYAIFRGYLSRSPFEFRRFRDWLRDDDLPRAEPVQKHVPLADLERLLAHLGAESAKGWREHRLYALVAATLHTGARAREVRCSLRTDWRLEAREFLVEPNGRRRLKTRSSRRRVVFPDELVQVLAVWFAASGSSEWAFPGFDGDGPWDGGSPGYRPTDRLAAAGEACGVKGVTFLRLRHSYITFSRLRWGVPEGLTRQLCGHTRIATTDGYVGFDRPSALEAVGRIGLALPLPPAGHAA